MLPTVGVARHEHQVRLGVNVKAIQASLRQTPLSIFYMENILEWNSLSGV